MTNKLQLITILTLATVLITGGFGLTPFAYSANNNVHDDKDSKWKQDGEHDDDEHDDDEHDDDEHDDDEHMTKPTITIVNKVASDTQPFMITVSQTVGVPVLEVIDSTTTKYTVDSHTTVKILGDPDRPILITGDGNCPENNGGFVNIESGQNIKCIYSDRPDVPPGGEGIIFRHHSMQVQLSDNSLWDSCDKTTDPTLKDPCIEIISAENGIIGIVDSALTSDTTIVLFSVIEADRLETKQGSENPVCSISAIVQHDKKSTYLWDRAFEPEVEPEAFPSNPTMYNVVVLQCPRMVIGPIVDSEDPMKTYYPIYNVNYAMIDPVI